MRTVNFRGFFTMQPNLILTSRILCASRKEMAWLPLLEELSHLRRAGSPAWQIRDTQSLHHQPQCAFVLVQRRRLKSRLRLRTNDHDGYVSPAMSDICIFGLIEGHNQQ